MSLYRDYKFRELANFGGAWLLEDASMVDVRGALNAQNVEYVSGAVSARHGYKATGRSGVYPFTGTVDMLEMYCWYAPFSTISATYSDSMLVAADKSGAVQITLGGTVLKGSGGFSGAIGSLASAPAGASMVGVGMRLYATFVDASQRPLTIGGVVTAYNNAGSVAFVGTGLINLFGGPSTYAPAASEPGGGVVTAGTHRIAYLLEYASGFTTRVSPDSGGGITGISTFLPITFVASGAKNARLTVINTWDSEVVAISVCMTTTSNLNQYYIVPGSRTAVSASFTITFDISDADLSSQGIDATLYLFKASQRGSAPGGANSLFQPFQARHVCLFGDRMAYLGTATDSKSNSIDALYISERNDYQTLTLDQHILQLPGQRPMSTMFRMGSTDYILGPHEIWAAQDNGDVPVTWPATTLIDGRHGTLALHGVEVAPSGQYAWIADQSGMYLFSGAPIAALPISYQQTPHWNRINWAAAYAVKIKDDATSKKLYVLVPLDTATTPSHIMVFDYTDGATWEAVRYSLDSLSGYSLGAMELVRNDLATVATGNAQRIELWVGSSAVSSPALRRTTDNDTTPYRDNGAAIHSIYRTCPLPGRDQAGGVISMHHGFHARLKGSGSITPVMYDIDSVRSFTCRAATLSTTPDADLLFAADLRGELAAVEFNTNTLDTYWSLPYLRYYHSPYLMQR